MCQSDCDHRDLKCQECMRDFSRLTIEGELTEETISKISKTMQQMIAQELPSSRHPAWEDIPLEAYDETTT